MEKRKGYFTEEFAYIHKHFAHLLIFVRKYFRDKQRTNVLFSEFQSDGAFQFSLVCVFFESFKEIAFPKNQQQATKQSIKEKSRKWTFPPKK